MAAPSTPSSSSLLPVYLDSLDLSSPQLLRQLASATIASLPTFPVELHHRILQLCDAQTLARTSRVSLAFLELSGPLLYQDISIVGFDSIFTLFCPKYTFRPQIDRYTSLSQTKTFEVVVEEAASWTQPVYPDRLPSSQPLALETLRVRASVLTRFPFHLFNPSNATFANHPASNQSPPTVSPMSLRPAVWSRLTKLVLRDCQIFPRTHDFDVGSSGDLVDFCRSEEQLRGFSIVFEAPRGPRSFTEFVLVGLKELTSGRRAVKEVVIRTARLHGDLMKYATENRIGPATVVRLKKEGKLKFEVLDD